METRHRAKAGGTVHRSGVRKLRTCSSSVQGGGEVAVAFGNSSNRCRGNRLCRERGALKRFISNVSFQNYCARNLHAALCDSDHVEDYERRCFCLFSGKLSSRLVYVLGSDSN